jgi:hypothetical protein
MQGYRLYRFNASGHFESAEVIPADTDARALKAARELLAGAAGELWLDDKLISLMRGQLTDSFTR